jgi:hypothetical protein
MEYNHKYFLNLSEEKNRLLNHVIEYANIIKNEHFNKSYIKVISLANNELDDDIFKKVSDILLTIRWKKLRIVDLECNYISGNSREIIEKWLQINPKIIINICRNYCDLSKISELKNPNKAEPIDRIIFINQNYIDKAKNINKYINLASDNIIKSDWFDYHNKFFENIVWTTFLNYKNKNNKDKFWKYFNENNTIENENNSNNDNDSDSDKTNSDKFNPDNSLDDFNADMNVYSYM